MKRFRYRCAVFLTALMLWCFNVWMTAAAASPSSVFLSITVSVKLTGRVPSSPDSFQIRLVPGDETTPMPEGNQDVLTIRGAKQGTFPAIQYTNPGVYQYSLVQIPGNAPCQYDKVEYALTVTVVNGEHGLESAAVLYQDDKSSKLDMPVFQNHYPKGSSGGTDSSDDREHQDPTAGTVEEMNGETTAEVTFGENSGKAGGTTDDQERKNRRTSDRELVPTGVEDRWPVYVAGILLLLSLALKMICLLRRNEESDDSQTK